MWTPIRLVSVGRARLTSVAELAVELARPGYARLSRASTERGFPCPTHQRPNCPTPLRHVAADLQSSQSARPTLPELLKRRASSYCSQPMARVRAFSPPAHSQPAKP